MNLQMEGEAGPEIISGAQVSEEQKSVQEQCYYINMLQVFDEANLDKNLQFKVIFNLKCLAQCYPNFIEHPLLEQFTFACIKLILNKSSLQHAIVGSELQNVLDELPAEILQEVEQTLAHVQNGIPEIHNTPYDLLSKLQVESMMNGKTFEKITSFLDYALTFYETFTSFSCDVLYACIAIYAAQNNEGSIYLSGLEDKISTNAHTLKEFFISRIQQDLII